MGARHCDVFRDPSASRSIRLGSVRISARASAFGTRVGFKTCSCGRSGGDRGRAWGQRHMRCGGLLNARPAPRRPDHHSANPARLCRRARLHDDEAWIGFCFALATARPGHTSFLVFTKTPEQIAGGVAGVFNRPSIPHSFPAPRFENPHITLDRWPRPVSVDQGMAARDRPASRICRIELRLSDTQPPASSLASLGVPRRNA